MQTFITEKIKNLTKSFVIHFQICWWCSVTHSKSHNWMSVCISYILVNLTLRILSKLDLDLSLEISTDGRLQIIIYDKRDDFNFQIVNCSFLSSNIFFIHLKISSTETFRLCMFRLIWIVLAGLCSLQNNWPHIVEKGQLKLELISFTCSLYHELVDRYGVSTTTRFVLIDLESIARSDLTSVFWGINGISVSIPIGL